MPNNEKLWLNARARMEPYLKAVFWQDHGISGPEQDTSVNWILDHIFRPEFIGATDEPVWCVMRQDDNGNHFEVSHGLSQDVAEEMIHQFEASGHKQHYWALPKPNK